MPSVTVRDFATEVKLPVDALLTQLQEAGIKVENADSTLSDADKAALLQHIRAKREKQSAGQAASGRMGLKRKTTTELKLGGGRGAGARTVSVEVRKRRTFEKPPAEDPRAAAAAEEARKAEEQAEADRQRQEVEAQEAAERERAEREQAEREEADRQAAEAQAEADARAAEAQAQEAAEPEPAPDAAPEGASETADTQEAHAPESEAPESEAPEIKAEDAVSKPAEPAAAAPKKDEIIDSGRRAASALRQRAAENLRRAAEMRAAQPEQPQTPAPARPAAGAKADKGSRKELHVKAGKSGRREKKSGRRQRVQVDNRHGFEKPTAPVVRDVAVPEMIGVGDLAAAMAVKTGDLIKTLMRMGVMATINQTLDQDTAVLVVEEMGHRPRPVSEQAEEEALVAAATAGGDEDRQEASRAPIVTVMGHVDHGKTSLLDYIRKSRVASGEAGGITQHIGAYNVSTPRGSITFLDTPGHAAFTRMRARGAQVTDIVILIIAADDGVMPQTREAIQHARAAGVPMVVAITKIDKEDADVDKIKSELTKEEVVVEDWGGDIQCVAVSSHTGAGVEELLDSVVLQAELLELKAVVDDVARGAIIESSVEKGRGPTATVLVRNGTLKQGDVIIAGPYFGRVRAMFDDSGAPCKSAGPSTPVQVLGLSGAPDAGEEVMSVTDERAARELAELREKKLREQKLAQSQAVRLDRAFERMGSDEHKQLNIMIRGDVQGSVEALSEALTKLPSEEVKVNIVAAAVGGISESDVDLAVASEAIIIGFNTRADGKARQRIQATGVDVRYYSIIYDVIDDISDAISGLLGTELREKIVGTAEVRDVFRSSAFGAVAGCLVVDGEVRRGLPIRVLRDQVVIYEGELESLRRHKDDAQKVEAGTECGIAVKNYNDVKVGDQIECYDREEVRRKVSAEQSGGRRG
ncbi:translation initiation factor IF-2 [Algiphilus sp.]|uniref:translation initiation factor IF-2 n=1 Tax=Algiphilus sp. TaxID=1872431 RepID=UPI0025C4E065|nr:translation initiation factor IF-2 [Algiphilus sp.]